MTTIRDLEQQNAELECKLTAEKQYSEQLEEMARQAQAVINAAWLLYTEAQLNARSGVYIVRVNTMETLAESIKPLLAALPAPGGKDGR